MNKLTKQLLTGVIALGLLAPIATSSLNPIKTTVNAKRHHSHQYYVAKSYQRDLRRHGHASYKFGRKHLSHKSYKLKHAVRAYYYRIYDDPVKNHPVGSKVLHKGTKVHAYYQGTEGIEWNIRAHGLHTSSHMNVTACLTSYNTRPIK